MEEQQTLEVNQLIIPAEIKIGMLYTSPMNDQILPAFQKALNAMDYASKDTTNPHFGKKYADLASCMTAIKPALGKNDLSLSQPPELAEDMRSVTVESVIFHVSGQYIRWTFKMPIEGQVKAHEVGKTITYARRYALAGVGIIAEDDDDGNSGSNVTGPPNRAYDKQQSKPQPPPPPPPKKEAKAENKPQPAPAAAPVTELGQFLAASDQSSNALDEVIARICKNNSSVQPAQIQRFLEVNDINKEPIELQVEYMTAYEKDKSYSAVATQWKRTGKSFKECFEEAQKETPDKWRESIKARAA